MLGTAHSQNGIQVTGVSLNCTLVPNPCPTYPNIFSAPPTAGGVNPSLYLFAKDYAQPYMQQGRLGVERELFANTSLSVSYLYFRGVHSVARATSISAHRCPLPLPILRVRLLPCCVIRRHARFRVCENQFV